MKVLFELDSAREVLNVRIELQTAFGSDRRFVVRSPLEEAGCRSVRVSAGMEPPVYDRLTYTELVAKLGIDHSKFEALFEGGDGTDD